MTGRWALLALGLIAGAVAALGHAPFGLWPLALIGFAGLIALIVREVTPRRAAWAAWAGGAGYFAVALHWIVEPFLVDAATHGWMAPFALVFMAGGLALFWGLAAWLARRLAGGGALAVALGLALAEMARGHVLTGFPWALPAYLWTDTPVRMSAALWGPYGLTALTLVLAALPSVGLSRLWRGGLTLAVLAGLFGAGAIVGLWAKPGEEILDRPSVRLVQPNVPQDEKWNPERAPVFMRRLLTSTAAGEASPDLIVWPETAIPYPLDIAGPVLARAAIEAGGTPLITGLNRRTEDGQWFNALVTVGPGGEVTETYDKVHLVPFGEYIPGRIDLLRRMAAFTGFGFTPGAAVRAIDTPLGRAVPLICYEAIFPGHIGRAIERPDLLIQITNDAWFGTFAGPFQHLEQARFRAAEQGLPLIRAANTGVSAVITPTGEVFASLGLGEEGYIDAEVPPPLSATVYARIGDLPVAALLLLLFTALSLTSMRNRIANRRKPG
ncbi:apolipoprotein N-acyltransferase [Alphaproteobacteria bacterium GH1-50]|uniref:Apolipoprotein N-acyltransferase n=1 Tax=Kangsaoukella pontilimi TaxID=2691042 RepID=A0A7C9IT05_9RHOB|nr:apolipoprotein N-acyltransferase [Kangsaoukella pontilimi]MXQ09166.1 apolipoprotein N-acyltransferase [Kangsaoukella pontilimi]